MAASIRVLHIDDEPGFTDLAADLLERESGQIAVTSETSSADGLETLRDREIDCVVSDHDMPGMTGIELLETVRETYPELPFILFTGKGSEAVASKAVSAGVTDYLQKGTGTDQYTLLANRIENAVKRFRSQQSARTRKRRLETLISNLPGVVYRCRNEPAWPMEYVDGECESLTGHRAEAIEDGAVRWGEDLIHPADQDTVWQTVQRAVDAEEPFECTYRIRTADGSTKWVWERGRGITTADGDVEALEGFITDVTERKDRERDLRRAERQFEAVFNDPNLLVGLVDADGTVLDINRTALEYVDAERDELVGDPFPETPWWTDDNRSDIERWIADAATGEYVAIEAVHPTDEGGQVTVEGSLRPVTDDDGRVTSIVVSARDITERRRRKEELKRRNEKFDQFASFVSHDLQSPISTVRGRLELARETGDMTHVDKAANAIERVDDLRSDLVDTLRTGEVVSETERVDLGSTLDRVWETIDPPRNASFSVEESTRIEASPDALQRLLENLVGNSVEHGGNDVCVRVGQHGDGIYYEDDGPGIDPEHRDRVFTPGFSTKNGEEGIGMGMASVRQIVLAHDWSIHVEDGETLDGVRFEIGPQ